MRKTGFPPAPVILGLVLGPLMEKILRRDLSLSDGDWSALWSSPISMTIRVLAIASLFQPLLLNRATEVTHVEHFEGDEQGEFD